MKKKIVLAMAAVTSVVWFTTSSLLLAGLSSSAVGTHTDIALDMDNESKTFRPVEFSAEVNLDDYKLEAKRLDINVTEKLNKAKKDMLKLAGTHVRSAVR